MTGLCSCRFWARNERSICDRKERK